jgi:hypothetical protein
MNQFTAKWTDEEIDILRRDYPTIGIQGAARNLPGRSAEAVSRKAGDYGLRAARSNAWTDSDIELLRLHYPTGGVAQAMKYLPERSELAICSRVRVLGIKRVWAPKPKKKQQPRYRSWTEAEVSVMREHYPRLGPTGCAPLLPGRSHTAIKVRAQVLGLRSRPPRMEPKPKLKPKPAQLPPKADDQDEYPIVRVHHAVGTWPRVDPTTLPVRGVFDLVPA